MADYKEVTMEVALGGGSQEMEGSAAVASQSGGGGVRSRRRRTGRKRAAVDLEGGNDVAVEKAPGTAITTVSVSVKPVAVAPSPAPVPAKPPATGPPPAVVIAPPKKRPAKLVLVPGQRSSAAARAAAVQKTFKAHKVRVLIDNTAKTQRRRRQTLQAVDAMTEDQLRAAAVGARLSRRETVAKVPVDLLRQMLKDYRMMRGMLV
jgi:hypothetical protein